jgi:hypothetical protein
MLFLPPPPSRQKVSPTSPPTFSHWFFYFAILPNSLSSSVSKPTRSRFSVGFLGPRANAELVPKFHVALHASHAALPVLSKFRPKVAPHINILISPNSALPRISKFRIVHESSKTLLNFSPCSTSHPTFSTSKRLTFAEPTFTRRTSGHCPGTFVAANINLLPPPPPLKSSAYRYSPPLSLLSVCFGFRGLTAAPWKHVWESRGIPPLISNLGTRWMRMVSFFLLREPPVSTL